MSKFVEGTIVLKDEAALVSALTEIFGKGSVEVVKKGEQSSNLYGYRGDKRAQTADIIIRRQHVNRVSSGCSNDLGFKRKKNGSIQMIVSEYDRSCKIDQKVQRRYSELVVDKTIKRLKTSGRFRVLSRENDKQGNLVIKIGRRSMF